MAVVERNSPVSTETNTSTFDVEQFDISANLVTLKVESTFPDDKKSYLRLRARSHMLQTSICAQLSFFVSAFNEARRIRFELGADSHAPVGTTRLFREDRLNPLKVGVIGCGHLGQRIVSCLLSYGGCKAKDIIVSTRRPETLEEIKEKGVHCVYDNRRVVQSCHFVILCVLPSQLNDVIEDIKDKISPHCLIYNLVPATPVSRLKQNLRHNQIVSPQFSWPKETMHCDWDYCLDIVETFQRIHQINLTCPVTYKKKDAVVQTKAKWLELICYALANHCTTMELRSLQATQIVNRVLLGSTDTNPGLLLLEADDLTRQPLEPDESMPIFDLTAVALNDTPLTRKLAETDKIRQEFLQHYLDVFEQYNFKLKFDPLHVT